MPAVGTPLTDDELLHEQGLEAELAMLATSGIRSVFIAGSMGAMPLLRDQTYRRLIELSVSLWRGEEIMAGAGDTSFSRTLERIEFLNQFQLHGVVVLAPYFWKFSQEDLVGYFTALAAASRCPLFLYDLPQVTGTKLQLDTVLALSKVPNIGGIKCSDEPGYARVMVDRAPEKFRVIIAQPNLVDVFLRHGINEHLDGIYTVAPEWTMAIGRAADLGDWEQAAVWQRKLSDLLLVFRDFGMPAFTPLMNQRNVPGNFVPRPFRPLSDARQRELLAAPIVRELLESSSAAAG
jgi:4-hydroxy-tetrahydrodipicolinate synthase